MRHGRTRKRCEGKASDAPRTTDAPDALWVHVPPARPRWLDHPRPTDLTFDSGSRQVAHNFTILGETIRISSRWGSDIRDSLRKWHYEVVMVANASNEMTP